MVNSILIVGRIGIEPVLHTYDNGGSVANFSVATSRKYKNRAGEMVEDTQWHNVVCHNKQAEFVDKWAKKGLIVSVQGEVSHSEYEGKDGIKRQKYEIQAREIQMITWPEKDGTQTRKAATEPVRDSKNTATEPNHGLPEPDAFEDDPGSDLPFMWFLVVGLTGLGSLSQILPIF